MKQTIEKRRGIIHLLTAVALCANLLHAANDKPALSEMQSTVNSFLKNHGQKEYRSYLRTDKDYKTAYNFIQVCGKDGTVRMERKEEPKKQTRELLVHCTNRQLDTLFGLNQKAWRTIREKYPRDMQYAAFYGNIFSKKLSIDLKKADDRARKTKKFENVLILGSSVFPEGKYKGERYSYIRLQLHYLDANGSEIRSLRYSPLNSAFGRDILMSERRMIELSKDPVRKKSIPEYYVNIFKKISEELDMDKPERFQEAWNDLTPKEKIEFISKMYEVAVPYFPIAGEMLNDSFLSTMLITFKPKNK